MSEGSHAIVVDSFGFLLSIKLESDVGWTYSVAACAIMTVSAKDAFLSDS